MSIGQEDAPRALPKSIKAKPVARRVVSDAEDSGSANQISFGTITRSANAKATGEKAISAKTTSGKMSASKPKAPKTVRTAESEEADSLSNENRVVQAIADDTAERGAIRRVAAAADEEIERAQWTATRGRSVLVHNPQDPIPSAPPAPKTSSGVPQDQPPGQRKLRADCGNEKQACEDARQKVYANTIDRVQIDISPLLFSDEDSKSLDAMIEASERLTRAGLKDSPFRSWTDRNGNVIAQNARLFRVRANSIVVIDASGAQQVIPLSQIPEAEMCEISDAWGIPVRCELKEELYTGRMFCATTFTWTASALCHKPLYFEQIELERYGHTPGPILEAPMAGAKFALDLATLPYNMGINPPNECQYALGYYRPGNCAPWIIPPVPLSLRGAIFQTAAVTGVSWIIP